MVWWFCTLQLQAEQADAQTHCPWFGDEYQSLVILYPRDTNEMLRDFRLCILPRTVAINDLAGAGVHVLIRTQTQLGKIPEFTTIGICTRCVQHDKRFTMGE